MRQHSRGSGLPIIAGIVVALSVPVYGWSVRQIMLRPFSKEEWLSLAGISVVACLSLRWATRSSRSLGARVQIALTDSLVVVATMIYGVAAGVLVRGASRLGSKWPVSREAAMKAVGENDRMPVLRTLLHCAAAGISAFGYGQAYFAFLPSERPENTPQWLLSITLLTIVYILVCCLSNQILGPLSEPSNIRVLSRADLYQGFLSIAASTSGAAVICTFHSVVGFWALLIGILALLVIHCANSSYIQKFEEVRGLYIDTVRSFADAVDALEIHTDSKSPTLSAVQRTQTATLTLARAMGVDRETYETLEIASALYDVGKISMPIYILHKPSGLTESELEKMRTHAVVGAEILSSINFPGPVIDIVRHHHENWDGSGYPDALEGDEIPYGARIIAVASCYEALRSPRIYRLRLLDQDEAVAVMKREAHRFDPAVFEKFLDTVPQIEEEWAKSETSDSPADLEEHRVSKKSLHDATASLLRAFGNLPEQEVCGGSEIVQNLVFSHTRTESLAIFASWIEKSVPFDTLVIFLMDERMETLNAAFVTGENKTSFKGLAIGSGSRLAGWVAANNRPLFNVDPSPDMVELKEEVRDRYQNALLVPLVREDRPLGAIALYRTGEERYSDDDIRRLEIIANRASMALHDAIGFEETLEDGFTDRLTGLPNSRFLFKFLEQALSKANRYKECLTVMEIELDDFKSVHAELGRHSADRLIQEVGRVLKAQIRDSDIVASYYNNEFIAVLPKTTVEQARQFSFRIQKAVEGTAVDVGGGKTLSVKIAVGVASFPIDGADPETLFRTADKNLRVQRSHRNRLQRSDPARSTDPRQLGLFPQDN